MNASSAQATGGRIIIASDELQVVVDPRVGGTITSVTHKGLGLSVLGTVPWDIVEAPIDSLAARDEPEWLTRFSGGWPLLFPNGGDACTIDGIFHGFHGEASIAPWQAAATTDAVELVRDFVTVPVTMRRRISVERELVVVREWLRTTGTNPVEVMWGHHPTFGSDLLAGAFEITAGAPRVTIDDAYDPPANPLVPGAQGAWPKVAGKNGAFDLGHPTAPMASLAYLHDFGSAFMAIRRLDNAISAALSWDADRFPCAWLWFELEGNRDAPWNGRTRLIGMEPNTTRSAMGIADARARGTALLRLEPGVELTTELRLHVSRPTGRITAIDAGGRAIFASD